MYIIQYYNQEASIINQKSFILIITYCSFNHLLGATSTFLSFNLELLTGLNSFWAWLRYNCLSFFVLLFYIGNTECCDINLILIFFLWCSLSSYIIILACRIFLAWSRNFFISQADMTLSWLLVMPLWYLALVPIF